MERYLYGRDSGRGPVAFKPPPQKTLWEKNREGKVYSRLTYRVVPPLGPGVLVRWAL